MRRQWWWGWLGPNGKTAFARARAILWLGLGVLSWPLGWMNSVALVWMASVYANVESGFATGEAADDQVVTKRLDTHEKLLREILDRLPALPEEQDSDKGEHGAREETKDGETGQRVASGLA
jgi:hypothetical protein